MSAEQPIYVSDSECEENNADLNVSPRVRSFPPLNSAVMQQMKSEVESEFPPGRSFPSLDSPLWAQHKAEALAFRDEAFKSFKKSMRSKKRKNRGW